MRRWCLTAIVSSSAVAAAAPACAHVIAPQYSVFDNGALHSVANLQLLVPLLALGIALGRSSRLGAVLLGTLGVAAFAAGALLWNQPGNPLAGFGTALAFVAGGAALMFAGGTGLALTSLAALVVGVFAGGIGRQEDPTQGLPGWFTLGVGIGAALVVFFANEGAALYRPAWLPIPLRIVASWLLAIGVMFFGLALKPPPPATDSATISADSSDASPCPGPHRHAPDGEIICLPVPAIDKAGTPSSIARYGNAPPPDITLPGQRPGGSGAAP
jgi:hypothetical protein